jgi:hypothetical protein
MAFDGDKSMIKPPFIAFKFVFIKLQNTTLLSLLKWYKSYNLFSEMCFVKLVKKVANFVWNMFWIRVGLTR